jgi:hypothetical protein
MDAIIKQLETIQEEKTTSHAIDDTQAEAISELTSIELAYVGGGTASMAFI